MSATTSVLGEIPIPKEEPTVLTKITSKNQTQMIVTWGKEELKLRTEEIIRKWPKAVIKFYNKPRKTYWNTAGVTQSQVLKVTTIKI